MERAGAFIHDFHSLGRANSGAEVLVKGKLCSLICKAVRLRYAFIKQNLDRRPVRWLYKMFDVHPCGCYVWRKQLHSKRAKVNQRLTGLIKQFWLESGEVYGLRKVHSDLRDIGEKRGVNRVYRLKRQFNLEPPDESWVKDITHTRIHE